MASERSSKVLAGLIGAGIQASRTPPMHMAEGARRGLTYIYRTIDLTELGLGVEALPELIAGAQRLGFNGLNITHPCKQAVIPLLDDLSDDARAIGAVNTVVFEGGRRIGHNTDWWGYTDGFARGLPDADLSSVLQLGAGGAGAAVAYALMKMGVGSLAIYDVDAAKAQGLADHLNGLYGQGAAAVADPVAAAAQARGVVQTTPVGMDAHPGLPIAAEALRPQLWVSEIIYFPLETQFLRRARAAGCASVDGSGMAVGQAVRSFELFTGIRPDAEAMRRDLFAPDS
jgi:shikimate dehydrogenase